MAERKILQDSPRRHFLSHKVELLIEIVVHSNIKVECNA